MSDAVIVALITTMGSIFVAALTIWNSNKAAGGDSKDKLIKENERLRKHVDELQEIVDHYRKKERK